MYNLSLETLREAYLTGQQTPRTLLHALRQQAGKQADFNAWIHLLSESELDHFLDGLDNKSPATHPLFGVPFAIKDNIDLAGIPTTAGCPDFSYQPAESAFVVQQLLNAGAIPLGKTNLDQFATGLVGVRSPYGEGKNVFNPEFISGGSSAGSAIATALGQVSFALGTDTAGSGRVPAAFNNLIGLKPSKGLLSNRGVVPACKSLDCVSIFTLNSVDAAAVFDIVAKHDVDDCYAIKNDWSNQSHYLTNRDNLFKFAVPKQLNFAGDLECASVFEQSVEALCRLGGEKIEIDFEPFLQAAKLLYEGPWVAERQWATQGVDLSSMEPVIQKILAPEHTATAVDCFDANYKLKVFKMQCDAIIADVDFVVTPTTPTTYTRDQLAEEPIKLNSILGTYTNFMNLLDYAAVAVPTGKLESGVHWGVTLFADRGKDITLLGFSDRLHNATMQTMGATPYELNPTKTNPRPTPPNAVDVVVCGAHLNGMPLNWQLTDRGGYLVSQTQSAACYRLYALPDGKRPALVRDVENGRSIDVEVWRLPIETFGSFVAGIPSPLGIGKTMLVNGDILPGFICEESGIAEAQDITEHGGWKAWVQQQN